MNTILRIAFRNVTRHKRRAFITALTMTIGIGIFIGSNTVLNGFDRVSVDNLVNLETSSVKIFSKAYDSDRDSLPLDKGIPDYPALSRLLARDHRVVGVTPRALFLAQAGNYRDSVPVVGTIIDPETFPHVFDLHPFVHGNLLTSVETIPVTKTETAGAPTAPVEPADTGQPDRRILLGSELATKLGLKIGDTMLLSASTRYDAENADDFTIVGQLDTSDPALNQNTVFITYAAANDFLDLGGQATEVDVKLRPEVSLDREFSDANEVASSVNAAFPDLAAHSFEQLNQGFLSLIQQKKLSYLIIVLVILLIAAVGIVNTVLMSVYERIREVGVLKALGFEKREVVWMFVFEGLFVGLLGSLMGTALGIGLDAFLVYQGIPMDKIAGSMGSSFAFWGTVHGEWNLGIIVFSFLFGLFVALIAALIPARRAARMTATAALHFV